LSSAFFFYQTAMPLSAASIVVHWGIEGWHYAIGSRSFRPERKMILFVFGHVVIGS
jgi:hypothetical protein